MRGQKLCCLWVSVHIQWGSEFPKRSPLTFMFSKSHIWCHLSVHLTLRLGKHPCWHLTGQKYISTDINSPTKQHLLGRRQKEIQIERHLREEENADINIDWFNVPSQLEVWSPVIIARYYVYMYIDYICQQVFNNHFAAW